MHLLSGPNNMSEHVLMGVLSYQSTAFSQQSLFLAVAFVQGSTLTTNYCSPFVFVRNALAHTIRYECVSGMPPSQTSSKPNYWT